MIDSTNFICNPSVVSIFGIVDLGDSAATPFLGEGVRFINFC